MTDAAFKKLILDYWRRHGRHDLPWRRTTDPYRILVSEVMLQQTQVPRVIDKYSEFLRSFPTFRALAAASPARVLKVWQGLGYNRRALMLRRCARAVVGEHNGKLPGEYSVLRTLPGIGPYTAGALLAFAFNKPYPIIETNIRRVYLHHYVPRSRNVTDAALMPLVARTMDRRDPRRWFSALMDYGTHLAATVANPNRRSRHHVRQSVFEGSVRQLRGRILRQLTTSGSVSLAQLAAAVTDVRMDTVLAALQREGFIRVVETVVHLAS